MFWSFLQQWRIIKWICSNWVKFIGGKGIIVEFMVNKIHLKARIYLNISSNCDHFKYNLYLIWVYILCINNYLWFYGIIYVSSIT